MKVTLDLDRLLAEGRISADEYRRFASLAHHQQASTAVNLLVGFGTIAVTMGMLALAASSQVAITLGLLLAAGGIVVSRAKAAEWGLLGSVLLVTGSLTAAGGLVALTDGSAKGMVLATVLFLVGALLAQSRVLAAMTAAGILGVLGAGTFYEHSPYGMAIGHPTITIGLFSLLAAAAFGVASRLPVDFEPLAIVFSRTCLQIVNFEFWIGSLSGDSFHSGPPDVYHPDARTIPGWVFAVAWAVALLAVGAWGIRSNRRFVVNLAATFAAIHFYTQWFERLGAQPMSVIVGGLLAIAIALGLLKYNRRAAHPPAIVPPPAVVPPPNS